MPIENEGNPTNWTLRFKHGRITILLFSEPLTPFLTLKDELLSTLRERYPKGIPKAAQPGEYLPVPDATKDVALAVPIDQNDISKGWTALDLNNGQGKMKDNPKSKGLKDGGVLAFRFKSEDEDEDENEDENEGGEKFVVEWSSYDDNYGEQFEQADKMVRDEEDDDE